MAWAAAKDIEKLGFNNICLNIEVKGTLYDIFVRPKLMYGLENAGLNGNDIRELEKLESKILKRACGLPNRCFSKPIINAMKIKSIRQAIDKRRVSLLKQLVENDLTRKILLMQLKNSDTNDTLLYVGIELNKIRNDSELEKATKIVNACNLKMKKLDEDAKKVDDSDFQKIVDFLFMKMTLASHKTLVAILDSWGDAREENR